MHNREDARLVRTYLAANLIVTCITAWSSRAYFHLDEYFQVLEFVWYKRGWVEAWALPWEHAAQMRPWMQPWLYSLAARALGGRDIFQLAFVFRLLTGLASWAALALFLRTTVPWLASPDEKRLHVRVATLLGFLPYLFVRTSSETLSMAAFTAAWAMALRDASPTANGWRLSRLPLDRLAIVGVLLGLAFEFRFQTALLALGLCAWLRVVGRMSGRALAIVAVGGLSVLGVAALVDRWGYGVWTFPPWAYVQANLVEGAATLFGADPPFAYAWLLPANLFFPIVVVLLVMMVVAWVRHPRHPITWAMLPFFVVHNLLSHKEERFVFPVAILATGIVVMAIGPSSGRPLRIAAWGWKYRGGMFAKILAAWSFATMLFLASWPLGWHHHVRFQDYVWHNPALAGDLKAYALPDFDLGLPAFHGCTYDVEKATPDVIAQRLDAGDAREWLVVDDAHLRTGVPGLDARATLLWSEVPFSGHPRLADLFERAAGAYNAHALPPLRPIRFRALYRLQRGTPPIPPDRWP